MKNTKRIKNIIVTIIALTTTLAEGQVITVGTSVQGDFDGDKKVEFATAIITKKAQGNPMDGGTPGEYAVNFSEDKLKSIEVGCCEIKLINEGNLNGDGRDEITVSQTPENGFVYSMTTYSFINNAWKVVIETFLVPTIGEPLNDEELQKRIFKENGVIYFYDSDLNDENFKVIKKKVKSTF